MSKEIKYKETEIGLIPEDWEVVKLKKCIKEFIRGVSFKSSEASNEESPNSIPILRATNMLGNKLILKGLLYVSKDLVNEKKIVRKNDIIITTSSGSKHLVGRSIILRSNPKKSLAIGAFLGILRINEKADVNYIYYLLNSKFFRKHILSLADGTNINNLKKENLKNFKIPLPPLDEQKKISYVLSTIQETIEKSENLINALKELKNSTMKHLFTYGAVKINDIENVKLKETEIGLIPENWEVKTLKSFVKTQKGKKPAIVLDEYIDGAVPYLTTDYFRTGIPSKYALKTDEKNPILVNDDDIVFLWDGSKAGDVFTGLSGILSSTCVKLNILDNNVDKKYFYYFLKTKFELFNRHTTGSTIPHVNKTLFNNLGVPIPLLDEQKKIANILSTIDQKIEKEENRKKALNELFNSMLNNLMTGKIRLNNINFK